MICAVDVADSISLSVTPDGFLERGVTITVKCTFFYGGPSPLRLSQEPVLLVTLDNEPDFPAGETYFMPGVDSDNLRRKTQVMATSCLIVDGTLMIVQ